MATKKQFTVINFLKDQSVAAVPTVWIDHNNQCSWPKKRPNNFKELVRDPDCVAPETWNKWDVEIIKSYDDYESADKKSTRFVKTNQVESSDGEVVKKRRKRATKSEPAEPALFKTPVEPFNQETDWPAIQPRNLELEFAKTDWITAQNVAPPATTVPALVSNDVFLAIQNQEGTGVQQFPPTAEQSYFPNSQIFESSFAHPALPKDSTAVSSTLTSTSQFAGFQHTNVVSALTSEPSNGGLLNSLLQEFRAFQITSIRNQEELKSEIRDLRKLLTHVLANVDKEETTCLDDLPLKLEDSFKSFNLSLKNKPTFDQLVTYLSKIGGSSVSKCVYNILKHTVSKELQGRLRYTSQSGKVCFGDSLLANAIREAVMRTTTLKDPTATEINLYMARWFRNWTDPSKHGVKANQGKKNQAVCDGESSTNSAAVTAIDIRPIGASKSGPTTGVSFPDGESRAADSLESDYSDI